MSLRKDSRVTSHHNWPRRRDRAVNDDAWIVDFLGSAPFGTLASSVDGQPYQNMNTFVYDPETHALYMHTAGQGRLRTELEANEKVSFCAGRMGRLLPADTAREFSVEYESVVIFGRASIVDDMSLARSKMQLLIDKYFTHLKPGRDYRPITDAEVVEITVIRVDVESWSGKRKLVDDDAPGAFLFDRTSGQTK